MHVYIYICPLALRARASCCMFRAVDVVVLVFDVKRFQLVYMYVKKKRVASILVKQMSKV